MAKNFVRSGSVLPLVAPAGGVVSGMIYLIGALAVVASTTAAAGEMFEGHTVGEFDFNIKTSANTPAVGAKAYLLAAGTEITTTASGNTLIGVFTEVGVNGSTACRVRLNGVAV